MRYLLSLCLIALAALPALAQETPRLGIPVEILSTPEPELDAQQEAREVADLAAQLDMAFWARWMFFASAASILVSAAALVGLLVSLRQTRASIKDNRTIGELQTQAYVQAMKCEFAQDGQILITCKNFGQSPATHFALNACAKHIREGGIEAAIKTRQDGFKVWSAIGSEQELKIKVAVDDEAVLTAWHGREFQRDETLLISGTIIYCTVFNTDHRTDFAFFKRRSDDRFRRPTANLKSFWRIPDPESRDWRKQYPLAWI